MSVVDPTRAIADAVLYEGYLLWPYRRSALKNRQRFTWGGVYPRGWPEGPHRLRAECLIEGKKPDVEVTVRFLQVVDRGVRNATGRAVDELTVGGERHLTWEEAVEREARLAKAPGRTEIVAVGACQHEELREKGAPAGAILRRRERLRGRLEVALERLDSELHRVRVEVINRHQWDGAPRQRTLMRTLCSTHVVLRSENGSFVSLADPPPHLRVASADCLNEGLWPVPVGEPGDRHTVLAAPIILEDHPRIAPESPGDLFDGGEIDQLLTLNVLSLSDEEKEEARATDPRAREILERTEALSEDELMDLHGAIRDFRRLGG